jgi:hypothetical protein
MTFVYKTIKRSEHKVLKEQELNELGSEGWELISTFKIPVSAGAPINYEIHYIFKKGF